MINFEHLFRSVILERGYDYYLSGMIKDINSNDGTFSAVVDGSSVYDVSISLEKDKVREVFCTCPYFDEGKNCKHIAALFYKLNESSSLENVDEEDESELESLDSLFKRLKKKELVNFLKEEMSQDASIKERFFLEFQRFDKSDIKFSYLNLVDNLLLEYCYDDVFIDYYQAREYENALNQILRAMEKLIKSNDYETLFMMIKSVLEKIIHIDIDDSAGTTTFLLEELMSHLKCVITNADNTLYNQVFEWASTVIKSNMFADFTSYIFDVWTDHFNSDENLNEKLGAIEVLINRLDRSDLWSYEYELSNLVRHKIYILTLLGKFEEGASLMKEYIHLHNIRSLYIEECINKADYDRAIQLLIEGKDIFADNSGVVSSYSKKLIEIYRSIDQKEELLSESKKRLFIYDSNSMQAYIDYKELFDEVAWKTIRINVIDSLKNMRIDIKPHLLKEDLLDELILEIGSSPYYHGLWTYEGQLYKTHSADLLELFKANILRLSESSGSRNHYKSIIDEIKHIRKYPEGQAAAEDLVELLTSKYKNRSAMLDEFRKAKLI